MSIKPYETIEEAADFFEKTPKSWCRADFAQNAAGEHVGENYPNAVRFCAYGIISYLTYKHKLPYELTRATRDALEAEVPHYSLINWNDDTARDKRDVIRLFRRVAKKLRAKEHEVI